jgi:hypothetical protein
MSRISAGGHLHNSSQKQEARRPVVKQLVTPTRVRSWLMPKFSTLQPRTISLVNLLPHKFASKCPDAPTLRTSHPHAQSTPHYLTYLQMSSSLGKLKIYKPMYILLCPSIKSSLIYYGENKTTSMSSEQ